MLKHIINKDNIDAFVKEDGEKILLFGINTDNTLRLEKIISEVGVKYGFCNYDENRTLGASWGVRKLPVAIILNNQNTVGRVSLPTSKEEILKLCSL